MRKLFLIAMGISGIVIVEGCAWVLLHSDEWQCGLGSRIFYGLNLIMATAVGVAMVVHAENRLSKS